MISENYYKIMFQSFVKYTTPKCMVAISRRYVTVIFCSALATGTMLDVTIPK